MFHSFIERRCIQVPDPILDSIPDGEASHVISIRTMITELAF